MRFTGSQSLHHGGAAGARGAEGVSFLGKVLISGVCGVFLAGNHTTPGRSDLSFVRGGRPADDGARRPLLIPRAGPRNRRTRDGRRHRLIPGGTASLRPVLDGR